LDTITHGLIGTLGSKTGYYQKFGKIATYSFLFGSIFPDIDIIVGVLGPDFTMRHHRGITHSLVAVPLFSILVTLITALILKTREYKKIYPMVLLGMYSHIFFDLITAYGTVAFDPISMKRYNWNLVFILDPIITLSVIAGLVVSYKRRSLAFKTSIIVFLFLTSYLLTCFFVKEFNRNRLVEYAKASNIQVEKLDIYPRPLAPFLWLGIIETKDSFYRARISSLSRDSLVLETYSKSDINGFVDAARVHRVAKLYYWFADFPVAKYLKNGEQHIVEIHDLRFRMLSRRTPFTLRYVFDKAKNITEITLGGRKVRKI
jgi:inner membrane protein